MQGVVFDDDDEDGNDIVVTPASISDTYIMVALPQASPLEDGPHTVRVRRNLRKSTAVEFTVGFPSGAEQPQNPGSLDDGWNITVTRADTSNIADGHISVLEAMLLASQGSLGRALELHAACEEILPGQVDYCGGVQMREVDWIDNFWVPNSDPPEVRPYGPGHAEQITVHDSIADATVVFNGNSAPPIRPDDVFQFNGLVLDGSNAETGAIGLDLSGSFGVQIYDVGLVGWDGGGIRVSSAIYNRLENIDIRSAGSHAIYLNGAQKNRFSGIMIDVAAANGVFLENHSNHNQFSFSTIQNIAGHGIELDGGSDTNTVTFAQMVDIGGRGISLAGASFWNSFTFDRIGRVAAQGIYLTGGSSHNSFWGASLDPANPVANIFSIGSHGLHLRAGVERQFLRGSGVFDHWRHGDFPRRPCRPERLRGYRRRRGGRSRPASVRQPGGLQSVLIGPGTHFGRMGMGNPGRLAVVGCFPKQ